MVEWLRLCARSAGGPGLIPGQGTRFHMLQLQVHTPQGRPSAARQINIKKKEEEKKRKGGKTMKLGEENVHHLVLHP